MITGPNFPWAVKVEPMMSTFARDLAAKVTGPETPPSLPAPAATCPRAAARRAERHGRAAEAGRAASRGDRDTAGVRGDEGAAALAALRRLAGRHRAGVGGSPPTDPGRPRTVAIARSDDQRMGARAARYGRDIPVTDVSGLGTARYGRPRTGPDRTGPDRTGPTIMPRPRRPTRAFPPSTRCTARPHNRRARARRHRAA